MGDRTRIRRIQVTKLFGIFDHDIPLNLNDRITIIHGPNGYGKTVILQMLDGLFSGRWEQLCRFPFAELVVELEDGGVVRVKQAVRVRQGGPKRKSRRAGRAPRSLVLSYVETPGSEPQKLEYEWTDVSERESSFGSRTFRLDRVVFDSGDYEDLDREALRLAKKLEQLKSQVGSNGAGWMRALQKRLGVRLIHTQRLGVVGDKEPAVVKYSNEIAVNITSLLATYASRSQELDSTFIDRLLWEGKGAALPMNTLQERLLHIEQKRARLTALGFLAHDQETHKPTSKLDRSFLEVLSVYVSDTERKLGVFDEMARKVQLFTDAVNKRFAYKRMSISKEHGFTFRSVVDDESLPLDSLSSGEQHELVLLYELLFKVESDTLVLIDEPEISLHLAWQKQFLGDLMEIVKISSFDVLVATHAPAIIGKHWELTVELEGPVVERNS